MKKSISILFLIFLGCTKTPKCELIQMTNDPLGKEPPSRFIYAHIFDSMAGIDSCEKYAQVENSQREHALMRIAYFHCECK